MIEIPERKIDEDEAEVDCGSGSTAGSRTNIFTVRGRTAVPKLLSNFGSLERWIIWKRDAYPRPTTDMYVLRCYPVKFYEDG